MKRSLKALLIACLIVPVAVVMAACGGKETIKVTKENVEKINNTMDLKAVEAIIGKATHDLRPSGSQEGRVAWNIYFDTKTTSTSVMVYIDFGVDGKVVRLEAESETHPIDGGLSEVDWRVEYS